MKQGKRYSVPKRRAREGKTSYKTRLAMLKGRQTRLVVRKSLKHMVIQAIDYVDSGDKVLMTTKSSELTKLGWKHSTSNMSSAYLTGLLAGTKLMKLDKKKLILDLGLQSPVKGNKLFAALKGVIDSGIEVPHTKEILPSADRLSGKHIADYGKTKNAGSIVSDFEAMKTKING